VEYLIAAPTLYSFASGLAYAYLTATAYIDPNTGGMLFQVLAVVLAFFSGSLLLFSAKIRMFFAKLMRRLRGSDES
jgi:hypothetical protein